MAAWRGLVRDEKHARVQAKAEARVADLAEKGEALKVEAALQAAAGREKMVRAIFKKAMLGVQMEVMSNWKKFLFDAKKERLLGEHAEAQKQVEQKMADSIAADMQTKNAMVTKMLVMNDKQLLQVTLNAWRGTVVRNQKSILRASVAGAHTEIAKAREEYESVQRRLAEEGSASALPFSSFLWPPGAVPAPPAPLARPRSPRRRRLFTTDGRHRAISSPTRLPAPASHRPSPPLPHRRREVRVARVSSRRGRAAPPRPRRGARGGGGRGPRRRLLAGGGGAEAPNFPRRGG